MKLLLIIFFLFVYEHSYSSSVVDLLIVNKSLRELKVISKNKVIKKFAISLGFEPIGKKIKKGDGKTPEGLYYIESKIHNSAFFLALKISYPNNWDIRNALKLGLHPGGQIMIHGLPNERLDKKYHNSSNDWTEGCIAVSNKEMKYLWTKIPIGTPIFIRQ